MGMEPPRTVVDATHLQRWKEAAVRVRVSAGVLERCGDPTPGSPLAIDDTNGLTGLALSDAAKSYLAAAVDNLTIWADLVMPRIFVEGVAVETPPRPHFTAARAGMECAAQAVWLVEPDDSATRIERLAALALADLEEMAKAAAHIGRNVRADVERRVNALRNESTGPIKKAPGYVAMVRSAAGVGGVSPAEAEVLWRTASAAAHGKLWFAEATHSLTVGEEFSTGRFRAVRTPDVASVSATVTFATKVLEWGVCRFAQMSGLDVATVFGASLAAVAGAPPRVIAATDASARRS